MPKCSDCEHYGTPANYCIEKDLFISPPVAENNALPCDDFKQKEQPATEIRTFSTGATRDTAEGKLSYVKGLSPIVLRRYLQYLAKHRKQPDGSMREFDNWKQGIPKEDYLDSEVRHSVDLWLMMHGFKAEDNHGPCEIEELCCAIIFNASGLLHEILKAKEQK